MQTLYLVIKYAKQSDILYTRDALLGTLLTWLKPLISIPLIFEVNGLRGVEKSMDVLGAWGRLLGAIARSAESQTARHATALVCVTTGIKKQLNRLYNVPLDRMSVISNGVNLNAFDHDITRSRMQQLYEKLRIPPKNQIIVYLGSLQPWQDLITLIRAFGHLQQEKRNKTLLIIGDGDSKSIFEAEAKRLPAKHQVVFTGSIPYDQVGEYVCLADVCAAPFTTERNAPIGLSPIKLYSYLACGKPVMATEMAGFDFLEEHNLGTLVPPGDAEAFAAAITKWLEDPEDPVERSLRIRRYAEQHCGWDRTARQVLDVCERVVAENR
jgi:glycosyltransferase involved in cell wall biosynthesis